MSSAKHGPTRCRVASSPSRTSRPPPSPTPQASAQSEALVNLATTAIATEAGRWYRVVFQFEMRNAQALTSYATARIRRSNLAGAVVLGPTGLSDRSGTASRDTVRLECLDQPGAQAAQVWCVTLQTDASTVDIYRPVLMTVEDLGN